MNAHILLSYQKLLVPMQKCQIFNGSNLQNANDCSIIFTLIL